MNGGKPKMPKKKLSPREVAAKRGCTLDFVYRELWADRFPGATKSGKHWVIPAAAVKSRPKAKKNGNTD